MSSNNTEGEIPKQEMHVEDIKQHDEAAVDFYHILGKHYAIPHSKLLVFSYLPLLLL